MSDVYESKQKWLEMVMASSLTPATKVFAYGIFKRMYGKKVVSNPTEKQISEDTGLSRSKFHDYRVSLEGPLTMERAPSKSGGRDRYTYTLNLNWDGNVPTGDRKVPTGDIAMYPEGTSNVPTGDANTTSNTTSDPISKTTTALADAPALPLASTQREGKELLESLAPFTQDERNLMSFERRRGASDRDLVGIIKCNREEGDW